MESPRFYLFYGSDEFTRSEAVAELRRRMGEWGEWNTIHLDGRTATLEDLRRACDTAPFLADRRLVLVTGLLARLGRGKERGFLDGVLRLLQTLPETTRLVLVEEGDLPEDHPVLRLAADGEAGFVRRFEPPSPEALPGWILGRVRLHGGKMERAAAARLAQAVGPGNLRLLDGEIRKLVTYVGSERAITVEDVDRLVPYVQQAVIFDLVDALGEREGRRAAQVLHRLLDAGENPLGILAMVIRQFRLILMVKDLTRRGESPAAIPRLLDLHPYVARKLHAQSANFSFAQLEHIYRYLLDLDLSIKTGEITPEAALDLLVAGLGE
ncbi:MAG: DNA polymerase III subunit delta [Anaerolineae bacterium]|nr:DNA polymerase III subunit delta [Anaerolineae bacterium]MDW8068861.1 DNA polymerase III subunit delta [Anaerolineae bacterium]